MKHAIGKPYDKKMDVTPDMAVKWLEKNTRNRPISQSHVNALVREIESGEWKATHQGIAFATDGTLMDGQHRLWAIITADQTIRTRVFFNEDLANLPFIQSTTKGRSMSDRINIAREFDIKITSKHMATLHCMVRGFGPRQKRVYDQEVALMAEHREAVMFAHKHLATAGRAPGVAMGLTRAVIARAFYTAAAEHLIRFCEVLRSGMTTGERDRPIILLRDFLIATKLLHGEMGMAREVYGKTERALLAYLHAERIARLYPVKGEHFPLLSERTA